MADFVDVVVEATGRTETVPADWIGHPVLGVGITLVPVAAEPVDPAEAPTERNTVEEIDTSPPTTASTWATPDEGREGRGHQRGPRRRAPPEPEPVPAGNPDVQTVAGQASTESPYPAVAAAADHLSTGGTEPSDETPAAGDEEN
jgi:hypothetical protein